MKYDFDKLIDRRGTACVKWDLCPAPDVLPLWVADMDFEAAPCIREALQRRLDHGVFGYVTLPSSYYRALQWWYERYGWTIVRDHVVHTIGVVPALAAIVKALTKPGDAVLLQSPVYNCFFSCITGAGCEVVDSPLVYKAATYHIDFEDLKRKAANPRVKLMLLCNPHNPAGRVWTEEELHRVGEICERNGVFVVSDEIHNGLAMPGHRYTPYATMGFQHFATCVSPSKSFNIAGLQNAAMVIPDDEAREKIATQIQDLEIGIVNPFGVVAFEAAYSPEGAEWLAQLNEYIYANYCHLRQFFADHLPELTVTRLEGTYLVWVECSALGFSDSKALEAALQQKARVWFNAGQMYAPQGSQFLRINIACPRAILTEALTRFHAYVRA
ncbi:MAG: pyridoxal phosphate-dependent aminotransferase [Bacteroidaceae bacterium]|nr:pyridoxal phosphate-dependent aminotransferase [Bacteroidaceae bacterium]